MTPFEWYVLDTNVAVPLLDGDRSVKHQLETTPLEVGLPCIVVGELRYGATYSARVASNLMRIDELLTDLVVVDCTVETAAIYARLKAGLRRTGRIIPDNDIWIAAIALEHDAALVTRDAHFDAITELPTVRW